MKNYIYFKLIKFLSRRHKSLIYYSQASKPILNLIDKVGKEVDVLHTGHQDYYNVYFISKDIKAAGDFAEVGVYKGGSARILVETKGDRNLYLFDTFEGIPCDDDIFYKGQYKADFEYVKAYLNFPKTYFYKGLFPESAEPIINKTFAFVYLDVDVYKSTLESLKFFYPRMSTGGCIMTHDYSYGRDAGVTKAFDEFFADKPETIIQLVPNQALIIRG